MEIQCKSNRQITTVSNDHLGCLFFTEKEAIQILFGGNISVYTRLAEQARQEAFDHLVAHAEEKGANAILAMRYDANEMASAVTEVLAYGTAVVLEEDR